MASSAMVTRPVKWVTRSGPAGGASGRLRGDDFAAVVKAASGTDMVRPLQLAAIGALGVSRGLQRLVRAAHIAPRLRGLFLWDCHDFSFRAAQATAVTNEFARMGALNRQNGAVSQVSFTAWFS